MLVDLQQGGEAWLTWRAGGIGASDIATILGENPWQRAYELWCLKTRTVKAPPPNAAMMRGTALEPTARAAYIADRYPGQEIEFVPACANYDDADYIRASADGWHPSLRHGVELKCPTSPILMEQARAGFVPMHYLLQCYGLIEVFDAKTWDFQVMFGEERVIIPVERDQDYWLCEILPQLQEFWERVLNRTWPKLKIIDANTNHVAG